MANTLPESLARDHALLHELTDDLYAFSKALADTDEPIDYGVLSDYARFFRVFGDAHYSSKLGDVFLPFLARGVSGLDPQFVNDVRSALQLQRYHVESMEHSAGAEACDSPASRKALADLLQELVASHRQVDRALRETAFPLVSKLSASDRADLDLELEQFDRSSLTNADRPEMTRIVDRLRPRSEAQLG